VEGGEGKEKTSSSEIFYQEVNSVLSGGTEADRSSSEWALTISLAPPRYRKKNGEPSLNARVVKHAA
jgi:hypothetical protein